MESAAASLVPIACLLGLTVFTTSTHAGEQAKTSSLSWVRLAGAESCISTTELSTKVDARLGRSVFVSPSDADISIEGRAERLPHARGFRMVVTGTHRDGSSIGTRSLESKSSNCRDLDENVELVIALMIDPDAELSPKPPQVQAPTPPPKTEVREVVREVIRERIITKHERTAPTEGSQPWPFEGFAHATLAFERLPNLAPGLAAGIRIGPAGVPMRVAVGGSRASADVPSDRSLDAWVLEGGWSICPQLHSNALVQVGAAVGVRAGSMHLQGHGFDDDKSADLILFDGVAGLESRIKVKSPVFVALETTAVVPIVRQRAFQSQDNQDPNWLYKRPSIGLEVAIGLGLTISP